MDLAIRRNLIFAALAITMLYGLLSCLWWYPTGVRELRGLPVVSLGMLKGLKLSVDGKRVVLPEDPTRDSQLAARLAGRREQEVILSRLRRKRLLDANGRNYFGLDPLVPSIGGTASGYIAHGRTFSPRQKSRWEKLQSQEVAVLFPGQGPRPGNWSREEHWVTASWEEPGANRELERQRFLEDNADGMLLFRKVWHTIRRPEEGEAGGRRESALNVATMTRGLEANLPERDRSQPLEAVLLDMWTPLPSSLEAAFRRELFFLAVLWLLSAMAILIGGICKGSSPRVLLFSTVAALVLGPSLILVRGGRHLIHELVNRQGGRGARV